MSKCPECNSQKTWKDGLRYVQGKLVQRYLCRSCGYRFSENHYKEYQTTRGRQICVTQTKGTKNLVRAKQENDALRESNTKGQIVNFAWHLKKLGRAEATITTYSKYLGIINKYGDLNDSEAMKGAIANHFKDRNTKRLVCCAYDAFTKFTGNQWIKPTYKPEHRRVFIPTEQELQTVINTGWKTNMIFSMFLYETGARKNEVERLEWPDLDTERNKVTVKASKNGTSRTIKISKHLMELLFSLPKTEDTVFKKL